MEIKGREFTAPLAATVAGASPGNRARAALRRLCALAVRAEPLLFLLLIPALPVPQKLLYLGLTIPLFIWICAWIAHGRIVERTPLDWAILPLLLTAGLSQALGRDTDYSLPKVTFLVWGIAAYYILVRLANSRPMFERMVNVFIALGVWMALLSLFAAVDIVPKFNLLTSIAVATPKVITRLWGFNLNPNSAAGALVIFIPLQAAWLLTLQASPAAGRPRAKWHASLCAQLSALLLTGAALLLTQTRGAWIALLGGGLALASWRFAGRHGGWVLVAVGGMCLALIAGPHVYTAFEPEPAVTASQFDTLSTVWRERLWADVLPAIRDFPWTGLGVVRLWEVLPALYPLTTFSESTLILKSAHNQLLEVAVSFGLPALAAYLALWIGSARMWIAAQCVADDRRLRAAVEGLSAGLVAYFLFGFSEALLLNGKVGIAFWLALGLSAAAHTLARGRASGRPQIDSGAGLGRTALA